MYLQTTDDKTKELNNVRQAEHGQYGQIKRHDNCPACQIADGPVVRRNRVAHESQGFHTLDMDMSGPREIADNYEGKAVAYAVVAVLRLRDARHRR